MTNGVPEVNRGQRILAAIVLADAVGFTARMSVDEEHTLSIIHRDHQLMGKLCQRCEGRVIKSMGDGLLMYFASAVQAVSCSVEIQRELEAMNRDLSSEKALQHRIGIHLGDVFFNQSDVMGNGVNIAARLQTEAFPGGICISQIVYDVVKLQLSLDATYAGPLKLKNIQEPIPIYHVRPIPLAAETVHPAASQTQPDIDPQSRAKLEPGAKVGGRYLVSRVLGQGGFGRSYLVEDSQRFSELCVLKEFLPANKSGRSLKKALDLFKREAKTLYQINHPQVPKFLACFTQGQRLFIVQEFIDGVTYSHLLRQRKREGGSFSEQEVTQWLMHMLQVLDYLHSLGIVHRDISPDNIIYCSERALPVLIDFGLVNDALSNSLTQPSQPDQETPKAATMVGKFGYSPPEQMHLGQCYPCSDLYALGVTAIVLLTGKYPRDLVDQDSLEWRWRQQVALTPQLAAVLNQLLYPQPKGRFQSAQEVMEAISPLIPNPSSPLPRRSPYPIDLTPPTEIAHVCQEPLQQGYPAPRNTAFVEQCRQELTRCIGPMASFLIEEALDQHPFAQPEELVEILASQLSNGKQATEFTSRMMWSQATPIESAPSSDSKVSNLGSSLEASTRRPVGGQRSSAQSSPAQNRLSPEFLTRCRQSLAQCVGPMADFLLEETLTAFPNLGPQGLVQQLSAQIPDPSQAEQFRQQLR